MSIYEPPQETSNDKLHKTIRAISSLAPFGSAISELWSELFVAPITKRRLEWMRLVAQAIEEIQSKLDSVDERLDNDEHFIDILLSATHEAYKTSSKSKMNYLQNFVINTKLKPNVDRAIDHILLRRVGECTDAHIVMLKAHADENSIPTNDRLQELIPGYLEEFDKWKTIQEDLASLNLVSGQIGKAGGLITKTETGHMLLDKISGPAETDEGDITF